MKTISLFALVLLTGCLSFFTGCDDDDYLPLKLSYPDENGTFDNEARTLSITPFSTGTTLVIKGGDGSYRIDNKNKEVVAVSQEGNKMVFTPMAVGSATVIIQDNSDRSYELSVEVKYSRGTLSVFAQHAVIKGDNITAGDKQKLEEEILKSIPVKPGGKYILIFSNENTSEGEVEIYPSESTGPVKGTFKRERKPIEEGLSYEEYTIRTEKNTYTYIFTNYNSGLRSTERVRLMFVEEVTDRYKEKYPELEKAYAVQGLIGQ